MLDPAYDAFLGVKADIDCDEEERMRTEELQRQIEEGISPSAWQMRQIDQVIEGFPKVFAEAPGTAKGVQHWIVTNPG